MQVTTRVEEKFGVDDLISSHFDVGYCALNMCRLVYNLLKILKSKIKGFSCSDRKVEKKISFVTLFYS